MIQEQILRRCIRCFLIESKQSLINIGFPQILASLIMQKFGKNGVLIGKWFKDYFKFVHWFNALDRDLVQYVDLYEAGQKGLDEYHIVYKKEYLDEGPLFLDPNISSFNLKQVMDGLKGAIEKKFFDVIFFYKNRLVNDIQSGKLKDLGPYKKLSFQEARQKYEQKKIFVDQKPIKTYDNGFKWINVGDKCNLVGDLMRNCGSAGVMGMDPDRTMIALFDPDGKPHIVVTYSPNEKMISGVEGRASSAAKSKYHDYVLDLTKVLDVSPRLYGEESKELRVKYAFGNQIKRLLPLKSTSSWDSFFKVITTDGKVWYTNGHYLLTQDNVEKAKVVIKEMRKNKERVVSSGWGLLFNNHRALESSGVEFLTLWQLAEQLGVKVAR